MPTVWSRASVAPRLPTAILKAVRGRAGVPICSVRRWPLRQQLPATLLMFATLLEKGKLTMKKVAVVFFTLISALSFSACNTVHGIGKDIEKGGEAIQKSSK
jgi:entericidin B